ncbi:DNA alkylation repair protein [Chloroflexota bacterium]
MNTTEVLQQLEAMGTAQNCKVYTRHGVGQNQFGVSMANLKTLKNKIKVDQVLAQSLWETGNHDARMLATMIASPKQIDNQTLEAWGCDLDNYVIADAFSGLVSQSPLTWQKMAVWTEAESEWVGQAGWNLLAHLAMKDETLADDYFRPYLATIERDIHRRKNRVRYSMNNALIAIGIRNEILQEEAIAVAQKIGQVEVDHGETNCKTPEAVGYIQRTVARKKRKSK